MIDSTYIMIDSDGIMIDSVCITIDSPYIMSDSHCIMIDCITGQIFVVASYTDWTVSNPVLDQPSTSLNNISGSY